MIVTRTTLARFADLEVLSCRAAGQMRQVYDPAVLYTGRRLRQVQEMPGGFAHQAISSHEVGSAYSGVTKMARRVVGVQSRHRHRSVFGCFMGGTLNREMRR